MHDDRYLSKEVAYFAQHGKNPVQQDRQENLLPEKRHRHIHGRSVTKRKQLNKEINEKSNEITSIKKESQSQINELQEKLSKEKTLRKAIISKYKKNKTQIQILEKFIFQKVLKIHNLSI